MTAIAISEDSADYCRRARRIRAVWRGDPARMQRALRQLVAADISPERDCPGPWLADSPSGQPARSIRIDWTHSAILGQRVPAARDLADQVTEHLVGDLLPYTARRALLRQAQRRGIDRFEANLIIAAVQNQVRPCQPRPQTPRRTRRSRLLLWLSAALAIESLLLLLLTRWLS